MWLKILNRHQQLRIFIHKSYGDTTLKSIKSIVYYGTTLKVYYGDTTLKYIKNFLLSIQQKNLLYKRALKLNDSNTWAQYKVYRNKLTHIKEYAKRLYIKNLVNDNKHDTSSLWKIINKIIHLKNVKKNNIPNKMYASKSESAKGPQAISNLFNKYFIEIGVNLASTIETPTIIDGKFNATSLIQSSCNSFFLEPIVEEEVVNYIRAMNPSKSTGRHEIPAK